MNGSRIWTLQDLSHMLHVKTLQHESANVSVNIFKHRLWNFFNFFRKKENALESKKINSSTLSNDVECISATWLAAPEITAITLNSRSPKRFLHSEENTGKRLETLKPLINYNELPSLLNGNSISTNKFYETLSNVQAGDFDFIRNDNDVVADKAYGDYTSKIIISTLRENQEPIIDHTIEPVRTDNLSIRIVAKNADSLSPVKSELKISEIDQQQTQDQFKLRDEQHSQKYDSLQSPELQFQDYTQRNLLSNTTKQQIQQQSQINQRIQTPTVISKSLLPSFETMQQSNTMTKTQNCMYDAAEPSAMLAEMETLRKKILSKRFSMKSHLRREYHTWKLSEIENDLIKCDDYRFSISDIRTTQQEHSARCESFQLNRSGYSGSSGNQGFRKPPSCLPSVPRRIFSSKSCNVIQKSIQTIETTRKDLSANISIVRLRNRVSLVNLQSFSCDASKSKKYCEEDDKRLELKIESKNCNACSQEVAKGRCQIESKICGKTRSRRKDTCDQDSVYSSQDDKCEKRLESKSNSCKRYVCPEMKRQVRCSWERDQCSEARQKGRVSRRDRPRQSRDSDCSQKQDRKSCKRRKDCEETDEARVIYKDSSKRKNDCKSKYEKQCEKRDIREKERRNCTNGNSRRRSRSRQKRNSSRVSGRSYRTIDGKRHYSQQSILSILRNRRSLSTLISDAVLGADVKKITRRFYADCSKGKKKDLKQSCEKQKRKCETKKRVESKKKCVKGPARCLPRKSTIDKMQTCRSTQKDKDKKLREPTQKVCSHEEYCANRKKEFTVKDKKPKKDSMKGHPSLTMKEKKSKKDSMKEQLDREYKEIDECKRGFKIKEKKDDKTKNACTEYKSMCLDRVINPYKQQQKKDSEKFANIFNALIFPNFYKLLSIQSRIINDDIPILIKNDRLLNVMFDRSFSTMRMNYQDDFATKQATVCSKMFRNDSVNNNDLYADELPNYIEIENDDEKEDDYDWVTGRPISETN